MIYQEWLNMNYDKICHIFISYGLVLTIYLFTKNLKLALIIVFLLGVIKELYDLYLGAWSWGDMVSNVIGLILAYIVVKIIGG